VTDDQLHDELERRADSASLPRDWARHDLLPAVRDGIDTRPQHVRSSLMPALAGLAAAIAILAVLVLALPRLAVGPSATSTPFADGLHLLDAATFADLVAAGALDGQTVLVEGTIDTDSTDGGSKPCHFEGKACPLGPLQKTQPALTVLDNPINTVASDPARSAGGERLWPWIYRAPTPVSGTLVLAVDSEGAVTFLGRAAESNGRQVLSVTEANALDVNEIDLGDVVLVHGWLWTGEGPGVTINIDCIQPSSTPIPGLPNQYCQPTSYLIDQYRQSGMRGSVGDDVARLAVQRSAAQAYGVRTDENARMFAIAPRLYGQCYETSPCWQWEVVARLGDSGEIATTPEPTGVATPTPTAHGIPCGESSISVVDRTIPAFGFIRVRRSARLRCMPSPRSTAMPRILC